MITDTSMKGFGSVGATLIVKFLQQILLLYLQVHLPDTTQQVQRAEDVPESRAIDFGGGTGWKTMGNMAPGS